MTYSDNSATIRVFPVALEIYNKASEDIWGNPSSLYKLGDRAHQLLGASHKQIAGLLDVEPNEVLFTSCGSESNNLAIKESAFAKKEFGKHIITISVEHASIANTFTVLKNMGYRVTRLPVDSEGRINVNDSRSSLDSDTTSVLIMGVNNGINTIQPTIEVSELLENCPNIHFHVDDVQVLGKNIWKQVSCPRADLMSLLAHKHHAPRGVSISYKKVGKMLLLLIDGGGQEKGLRFGAENLPAITATVKAMRSANEKEAENYEREYTVKEKIYNYLADKPGITTFLPLKFNLVPHVLTFSLPGIRGETLVHTLEQKRVYVSTTSACASKVSDEVSTSVSMEADEKVATSPIRLSSDASNTLQEADKLIKISDEIYRHFAKANHLG